MLNKKYRTYTVTEKNTKMSTNNGFFFECHKVIDNILFFPFKQSTMKLT